MTDAEQEEQDLDTDPDFTAVTVPGLMAAFTGLTEHEATSIRDLVRTARVPMLRVVAGYLGAERIGKIGTIWPAGPDRFTDDTSGEPLFAYIEVGGVCDVTLCYHYPSRTYSLESVADLHDARAELAAETYGE